MIKLRGLAVVVAATALAVTSSAPVAAIGEPENATQPVDVIEGITWILTRQLVAGEMAEMPDLALVSLGMDGGQAGGQGACNSYFTSYQLDGQELAFGPIGSTMMACQPPLMQLEQAYFANLAHVAAYRSTGGPMILLDAGGNILLEFAVAPAASIMGTWVATGINDQQEQAGVVSSGITAEVSADFSPDGDLTGSDGCNRYFTSYRVDGDSITIDEMIGTTKMACRSDELAQQSQWYLGAMVKATSWSIDAGGNLELRDETGALQVRYAPAP